MIWLAVPALAACAYYLLACVAALVWQRRAARQVPGSTRPPVSILKPVRGRDPRFYEAIRSHAVQRYPEFEILFGAADPQDPALEDIERLRREFPALAISVHVVRSSAPNAKVAVLSELARCARYPVLLVNDSDIIVEPDYLSRVVPLLETPGVGLVTCLYRAGGISWSSRAEALGIATDFAVGVIVARLLGVAEFALGSTMAFRAETLAAIGGFKSIEEYLADDYQLGSRIHALGLRIEFSPSIVETVLGGVTWRETWRHQVRWSRTIRVSRPSGYWGCVVTHATVWALLAACAGWWQIALVTLAARLAAGLLSGALVLGDRSVAPRFWLIPLRDLAGFAIWLAGLAGNTIEWREQSLRLRRDGRIEPAPRT